MPKLWNDIILKLFIVHQNSKIDIPTIIFNRYKQFVIFHFRTDAFHMSMISHHTASVRESRLNSSISAPYHFKASDKISSASASNKTLSSLMGKIYLCLKKIGLV